MSDPVTDIHLSRRKALSCLGAWSGAAVLWSVAGGVPRALGRTGDVVAPRVTGFTFAQISDTHLGFHKDANPDVAGTLQRCIADLNALPHQPAFVAHTGDITHLSKPAEFDAADQLLGTLRAGRIHHVPGEHDALDNGLTGYLQRHGKQGGGKAWYSFDDHGVHFVGLSNVVDFEAGRMPALGDEQLAWLEQDLAARSASTPIVILAHIPLWTVYEKWGWGTADSPRALSALGRFGSVTVLNGHIHQVMQKVEGHVAFHTAMSTAYPQPAPGTADSPGPLTVPAGELGRYLGTREMHVVRGKELLATVDRPLAGMADLAGARS
ncbi:MAG TPA: metallophosphoesterase [Steroidobacteraceae bacterium]|nr:metallophosphoesterase [Steroidobacteraceae bacterium]